MKKMEQARTNYEQQKASMKESNKKASKPQKLESEKKSKTNENGRVGQRPYARGRAFSDDHYKD